MKQPTKLFSRLSILIILSLIIFSCNRDDDIIPVPDDDIITNPCDEDIPCSDSDIIPCSVEDIIPDSNTDTLLLNIGCNNATCEKLEIFCPSGVVCDENYTYRAYSFRNSKLYFYISFDPNIIGDFSLESLRCNFNYVDFSISFPERDTTNSSFGYSHREPIRQLCQPTDDNFIFTIDDYDNGIMKGTIKGTIKKITESIRSDSSDCFIGDIQGICTKTEEANIPFTVIYNFCID